jgi:hypothetical protein
MRTLHVRDGEIEGEQGGELFSCVYSGDGAFVLSAGWDGYLRLGLSACARQISSLQASSKPLSCWAFEGMVDTPLLVTPTPLFKPRSGVITRFLGKQKVERSYQYNYPACGHTAETLCLPREAIPCPSCKRLLRVSEEVAQLQPQ